VILPPIRGGHPFYPPPALVFLYRFRLNVPSLRFVQRVCTHLSLFFFKMLSEVTSKWEANGSIRGRWQVSGGFSPISLSPFVERTSTSCGRHRGLGCLNHPFSSFISPSPLERTQKGQSPFFFFFPGLFIRSGPYPLQTFAFSLGTGSTGRTLLF